MWTGNVDIHEPRTVVFSKGGGSQTRESYDRAWRWETFNEWLGALLEAALAVQLFREYTTMNRAPWNSINELIYHNETACNIGKKISIKNLREGTGGKVLCRECADLAHERIPNA